ncbi:MAG TPA: fatty acid desaturase [Polyangiaceae bacterium]|nr:fatty acid desaturase [Polyangiaceae bacterium]
MHRVSSSSKLLRHRADWRTLLWAFVLMPGVGMLQYAVPALAGWLLPLGLYTGFCAGVLAHNHNHHPTFRARSLDLAYACWLSVFYGYPIFGWRPTHNGNHHRFVNRPGDAIATWQHSSENTWLAAASYFFAAAARQAPQTRRYVAKLKRHAPKQFRHIVAQGACAFGAHATLLAWALWTHGAITGALLYASAFGVPAFFALWSMFFINFIQHVHCDPSSKYDHSRNFVSPLGNFLVFNAGLHTAHHESPALHWAELPSAHARIAGQIRAELKQASIFGFCLRAYVLGAVNPRFRTRQIDRVSGQLGIEVPPLGAVSRAS